MNEQDFQQLQQYGKTFADDDSPLTIQDELAAQTLVSLHKDIRDRLTNDESMRMLLATNGLLSDYNDRLRELTAAQQRIAELEARLASEQDKSLTLSFEVANAEDGQKVAEQQRNHAEQWSKDCVEYGVTLFGENNMLKTAIQKALKDVDSVSPIEAITRLLVLQRETGL